MRCKARLVLTMEEAMQRSEENVDIVAEALWRHRWGSSDQTWENFKETKPDIAKIYRDNAAVALLAMETQGLIESVH